MKTTIQISEDIRKRLKILSSYRDVPYEQLLQEILDVFEHFMVFKDLTEFVGWFERNLSRFGLQSFSGKKQEKGYVRYVAEDVQGKKKIIALQIIVLPEDTFEGVDEVICIFTAGVPQKIPVRSLSQELFEKYSLLKSGSDKTTEIVIPKTVEKVLQENIQGTGFSSVSDYVTYILRQVIANYEKKEEAKLTEEEEEKVRDNLRGLGYLR